MTFILGNKPEFWEDIFLSLRKCLIEYPTFSRIYPLPYQTIKWAVTALEGLCFAWSSAIMWWALNHNIMIMKHLGRMLSTRCFLNIFSFCASPSKSPVPTVLGPLADSKRVPWAVMGERGNLILASRDICILFFIPLMWLTASVLVPDCSFDLFPVLTTDVLTHSWSVDSEGYAVCPFLQQQKWHQIYHCLKTDTMLSLART